MQSLITSLLAQIGTLPPSSIALGDALLTLDTSSLGAAPLTLDIPAVALLTLRLEIPTPAEMPDPVMPDPIMPDPIMPDPAIGTQLLGLTDDNTLVWFNTANPAETMMIPVTGINGTLLGIDTRPANGLVYGLTTANELYTLDPLGFSSGTFSGSFTLTDEEESLLDHGNLYLNLHTQTFNGGELRGQIEVEPENDIVTRGLVLSEDQQVGAVVPDGPATGSFDVIYDDATNTLIISGTFSDLSSDLLPIGDADAEGNPQSAIHLHSGMAGANGPIVRNFTVDPNGSFTGTFTLTDAEEALLLDSALYVNIHTASANGGELRGQVNVELEGDIVISGIPIETNQEVGEGAPVDGMATGQFGIIYDRSTQGLDIQGSFSDLSSPLLPVGPAADVEGNPRSALHLHRGAAGENGPIVRSLTTTDNVATLVSTLSEPFSGGVISGFDFNPVADRLRLVGDNDQSFRINVDTGAVIVDGDLAFAAGDINAGVNPNITASAYTNSVAGATTTQLYNLDPLLNRLVLQSPPNDGTLQTLAELDINLDLVSGFDIVTSEDDENTAFVVSNATLYQIDLESGATTNLGMIGDLAGRNFLGLTAFDPLVGMAEVSPDEMALETPDSMMPSTTVEVMPMEMGYPAMGASATAYDPMAMNPVALGMDSPMTVMPIHWMSETSAMLAA